MMKRLQVAAIALVLLLVLALAAGAAADAASTACYGEASVNGTTETIFYVTTTAKNASIVLSQTGEGTLKFSGGTPCRPAAGDATPTTC